MYSYVDNVPVANEYLQVDLKMKKENDNIGKLILRIALGSVLLWFGINQLLNSAEWIAWIDPSIAKLIPFKLQTFIIINGVFEIITGTLLLLGLLTRLVSLLVFIHLSGIALSLGYNDIAVRDVGLALSSLALFFLGSGKYRVNKPKKMIFFILAIVFLTGCQQQVQNEPLITVEKYFNAWNDKDYKTMYNLISDGFKKIEPTAKTFENFKNYAEAQNIEGVKIIKLEQEKSWGNKAVVNYNVKFITKEGREFPFKGKFTLKYKSSDKIPGWKLIHPYGEKIDES